MPLYLQSVLIYVTRMGTYAMHAVEYPYRPASKLFDGLTAGQGGMIRCAACDEYHAPRPPDGLHVVQQTTQRNTGVGERIHSLQRRLVPQ